MGIRHGILTAVTGLIMAPANESALATPPSGAPNAIEVSSVAPTWHLYKAGEISADEAKQGRLGRLTYRFATVDTLNKNRRIYPRKVFEAALAEMVDRINRGVVYGRLDHPDWISENGGVVTLKDAAVIIVEAKLIAGTDEIEVVLDIMDNEHGRQLVSIFQAKGKPGISQRGYAEWREPTDEERERYSIPENAYVDVAAGLRLITFDVVSDTGFAGAGNARVTESSQERIMNLDELKAKHPALFMEVKRLGAEEAKADVDGKREQIASEAVKPVQEKLDAANKQVEKLTAILAPVKETLVAVGLVNEKLTDTEAAVRVTKAETELASTKTALETAQAELKKAQDAVQATEADRQRTAVAQQIHEQYKADPRMPQILRHLMVTKPTTLEAAHNDVKHILAIIGEVKPPAGQKADDSKSSGGDNPGATGTSMFETFMSSLVGASAPAQPTGEGAGGGGKDNKKSASEIMQIAPASMVF